MMKGTSIKGYKVAQTVEQDPSIPHINPQRNFPIWILQEEIKGLLP